jgi:hypothetical protein
MKAAFNGEPEKFIRANVRRLKKQHVGTETWSLICAFEADIEIKCARKEALKEENRILRQCNDKQMDRIRGLIDAVNDIKGALLMSEQAALRQRSVYDTALKFNVDRLDKLHAIFEEVFPNDLDQP